MSEPNDDLTILFPSTFLAGYGNALVATTIHAAFQHMEQAFLFAIEKRLAASSSPGEARLVVQFDQPSILGPLQESIKAELMRKAGI